MRNLPCARGAANSSSGDAPSAVIWKLPSRRPVTAMSLVNVATRSLALTLASARSLSRRTPGPHVTLACR